MERNKTDLEQKLPQCDGAKVKRFWYCENCNLRGTYVYKDGYTKLICDYYEDVFLKKADNDENQQSQQREDIKPTINLDDFGF